MSDSTSALPTHAWEELGRLSPSSGSRILVVEDEESIAQFVTDVLEDVGYEVRRASNGREGLELLAAWLPDLIVLDLMMPVLDGRGFRERQLELDHGRGRIPVIVLSGAREARAIADELHVAATLTKPFDIDDLLRTIERLLAA
jgi:CheY-like chemotaxis protein